MVSHDFVASKMNKQPNTKFVNIIESIHGVKISDPYRWLEQTDSLEVREWIKKQNEYSNSLINNIEVKNKIKKRFRELFLLDYCSVPIVKNKCYFYEKKDRGNDLNALCVKEGIEGKERILIDLNKLPKGEAQNFASWSPSEDGRYLVYALSKSANDKASLYIFDVNKNVVLPDTIPDDVYPCFSSFAQWSPDGKGFWYSRRPIDVPKGEEKFHQRIYFHKLGADFRKDNLIFGNDIKKEDLPHARVSEDGHYLLVSVYMSSELEKTELYLKNLRNKNSNFIPLTKNLDALFYAWFHRNMLYIETNYKAPYWKIMKVETEKASEGIKTWKTVLTGGKYTLGNVITIKDDLFIEVFKDAHSVLKRYSLDGKFTCEIPLPKLGSVSMLSGEHEGEDLFFGFSSFNVPYTIYRLKLAKNKPEIFHKIKIRANLKFIKVKQIYYQAKDGTKIPMFVIHKKNLKLNGNNPAVLYGYGGFGINETPYFRTDIIPFIENEGIYAIANIRGGGEFGEEWHRSGSKENKQNSINDFIAGIEWLINNKYTSSKKLGLYGWSNGGLLVGSVITKRPEIAKVAIVAYPVLDMLRYHKFFGGRLWIAEYGNPDDKRIFNYLLSYSPYHNVKKNVVYPATLILTAKDDDRVHPMHAYKMTAILQKYNVSNDPILLHVESSVGHAGQIATRKIIDQYTYIWSFIFWQLGVKNSE